ncbi:ABC transporter ATP-binding protein [Catenulispora yoronensis]|uniref:ABC transporter ATP-binding protein n=1 Tax=Catenulispora yoronensis TaxID=450799 RepID=A0ABN2UK91_9ACTN
METATETQTGTDPGRGRETETAVVELREAGLTYPGPPPVAALLPCDLAIARGDYVAVVGPSGSGKSTFLNVVGLLDRPTQGAYLLDGIDTAALPERDRTALRGSRIGFVFQSFHLMPYRSAVENVALAMVYNRSPRKKRTERAVAALEQVGLGHRLDALPTRLSGGERQRVAIARALVNRPSLLLCDEPTGNLDSRTAEAVLSLLDQLHGQGLTIVVITHDANVAARGQRTVSIRDGVLTSGPVTAS